MHVEKCPVCEGRGHVPQGFYLDLCSTTGTCGPVICRACQGKGFLFVQDEMNLFTIDGTATTGSTSETCNQARIPSVENAFTIKPGITILKQ